MLCVILFGLLTIDVVSFHWFRTFSLWGVNKYYRKFHSFSWLENISNHHWLSLSCSPCALTALEYAWYWHFNCFFGFFSFTDHRHAFPIFFARAIILSDLRCSFALLPFLISPLQLLSRNPFGLNPCMESSSAYDFKTWHCLFGNADFRLLLKLTK